MPEATGPGLRVVRLNNRYLALGMAVDHLMSKPAYSMLKFNAWSKILAGQINRGHYRFVLDLQDRLVGMVGWMLTDAATAERWAAGQPAGPDIGKGGDCIVFNLWSADGPDANARVLDAAREAMIGCSTLYYRRMYEDGRMHPVRLSVNRFVRLHLDRKASALGAARTIQDRKQAG